MARVDLSMPSLICILISVQLFVSVFVIGTITYMNNAQLSPSLPRSVQLHLDEDINLTSQDLNKETAESYRDNLTGKEYGEVQIRTARSEQTLNTTSPRNKFIILTSVNAEFVDIAENWLESIRRLGLRYNITVVAEDQDTYRYFSIRSNPEFRILYQKQYAFNFTRRYGPVMMYQELIRRRTVYIRTLLEQGNDVLLVDVDTVWIKNPVKLIMDEYGSFDMWLAEGYDNHIPCPCFMYMKSAPNVIAMVREWVKRLEKPTGRRLESDQVALTKVLPLFPNIPTKRLAYDQFPTGKHYFDREWLAVHQEEVYVAHGNHLGRHDGKKKIMKDFGMWLLNS